MPGPNDRSPPTVNFMFAAHRQSLIAEFRHPVFKDRRRQQTVMKMRGSEHSKALRLYDVTKAGVVIGDTLHDYRGIISGIAQRYQRTEAGTD